MFHILRVACLAHSDKIMFILLCKWTSWTFFCYEFLHYKYFHHSKTDQSDSTAASLIFF